MTESDTPAFDADTLTRLTMLQAAQISALKTTLATLSALYARDQGDIDRVLFTLFSPLQMAMENAEPGEDLTIPSAMADMGEDLEAMARGFLEI